ncbi:MAG: hypothetical protein IJJ44_03755 [Solobacterium sp.]|nr:hypothetical protein [Solobacterium sp.]
MKDQRTEREALKDNRPHEGMLYLETETGSDDMAGKTSEAQKKAVIKYNKAKVKQFKMNLNKIHDADIIDKLESVLNKQGYVKQLIREDIQKEDTEQGKE